MKHRKQPRQVHRSCRAKGRPSGLCQTLCRSGSGKGSSRSNTTKLDSWSYIQQVDYEQIPFKCKICHEYGHFAKSCPQAKDTQDQDPKQDQWQQPKRKKPNGKTQQTLHQNQREKLPDPKEKNPRSPQKGESSHNRYVDLSQGDTLPEAKEPQEETSGKGPEVKERGIDVAPEKNKEVLELSEDPSQSPHIQNMENLEISEEEGRDSSESESELELTQTINNKKPGRKSYRNKRESTADREKELGIQKTIEESLKKDGKVDKNKAAQHKGTSSQPSRGGAPKHPDK
jgi:hypothetical protein